MENFTAKSTPTNTVGEIIEALKEFPSDALIGYMGKEGLALVYTISLVKFREEEGKVTLWGHSDNSDCNLALINAWDFSGVRKGFPPVEDEEI